MAKTTDDYDQHDDQEWFRDELRQRDRLIAELRSDLDNANDLNRRWSENFDDYRATMEQWRGAFDMVLDENGCWSWDPFIAQHWKLLERHNDLVKRWNRMITVAVGPREVGRPLAADEEAVNAVLDQHKQGKSLREIAFMTDLSLQTVRTIIGRKNLTDRTSKKRRKIAIDQHERAHWKAQKRTIDALPKRIEAVIKTGEGLVKEAKGLGRGR